MGKGRDRKRLARIKRLESLDIFNKHKPTPEQLLKLSEKAMKDAKQ